MEKKNSILVSLNDSISSRAVVDYLAGMSLCPEDWDIQLLHFFRRASSSEELMGKKFTEDQPVRMFMVLEKAKEKLAPRQGRKDRPTEDVDDEKHAD